MCQGCQSLHVAKHHVHMSVQCLQLAYEWLIAAVSKLATEETQLGVFQQLAAQGLQVPILRPLQGCHCPQALLPLLLQQQLSLLFFFKRHCMLWVQKGTRKGQKNKIHSPIIDTREVKHEGKEFDGQHNSRAVGRASVRSATSETGPLWASIMQLVFVEQCVCSEELFVGIAVH